MSKNEEKKMTLEEYQKKYSKPENIKSARTFLYIFAAAIGVIVFVALFLVVTKLFDIHEYAGYASIPVAVLIYIFVYIVPLVKIVQTKPFITNVDSRNAKEAQRYNRELRNKIADKMIELKATTEGVSWYSDELIGKLAIARQMKNDKETKIALTNIYDKDVRIASNKMIRDHAFKVGVTTALSQSEKIDTLFVVAYNLSLIKDIVFLYGYRPSDAKLAKIYRTVIVDALVAYGVGNATGSMATAMTKFGGAAMEGIPILGKAVGTIIDSVAQGIINSSLTVLIGFQTKKYLKKEYHLQDILDEIDLDDAKEEETEREMVESLKEEIKDKAKKKKLAAA